MRPFRNVFQRYELLSYLTVRAGQIGMKVAHLPVRCFYPANAAIPTRITGIASKLEVLKQTFSAAFGQFSPSSDHSGS